MHCKAKMYKFSNSVTLSTNCNLLQAIPGVPKIKDGCNPATWMLEISSPAVESRLGVDFAELYTKSELYQLSITWRCTLRVLMPLYTFFNLKLLMIFPFSFLVSTPFRRNQELIKELSTPLQGTKDLYFPSKYSQSFITQCKACFWKQKMSYWRNPQYNVIRFFLAITVGLIFGFIFWKRGDKT